MMQPTSHKASQRPDDKLEWQNGKNINITDNDRGRDHNLSIIICYNCGFSSQMLVGDQELT
jgi:hypothetical protein